MSKARQSKVVRGSNEMIGQAFTLNKVPLPWNKALLAGVCSGLSILAGVLSGDLNFGLLAVIGSFTYLYVANIPYALRAKKLFFVMAGMTFSVWLGTLLAAHPVASALAVGAIGAIVTFVFGSLNIKGPAAIFFVFGFSLATGMPLEPENALYRAGAVLLGSAISWVIGMIGWLYRPHGPETDAVQDLYKKLAAFLDAVGTGTFHQSRQELLVSLKIAEDTLVAAFTPWKKAAFFHTLLSLHKQANTIFLEALDYSVEKGRRLPPELAAAVRHIAKGIRHPHQSAEAAPQIAEEADENIRRLFQLIQQAEAMLVEAPATRNWKTTFSKPGVGIVFGGAFDKHSIVFLTAVRYGVVLIVAALVAYSLGFNRAYWVTLSCASVMSGATIIATFHRAIQRSVGTIVGILIAAILLQAEPEGYVLIAIISLLTVLTELAIVVNYAIATFFLTPNALLLVESTIHTHNISYLASVRFVDVLIGCAIGLVGALVISRRHASSLLPHLMAKTIRSQQQFLLALFSGHTNRTSLLDSVERRKMHTNLTNLQVVYATALGEIPGNKKRTAFLWPAFYSIVQLGYLLEACMKYEEQRTLPDTTLSRLLLVFETMAKAAEDTLPLPPKEIPHIPGYPNIEKEIRDLQDALLVSAKGNRS